MEPKVEKVADMLGISVILQKYLSEVSGGQKQRVHLCMSQQLF